MLNSLFKYCCFLIIFSLSLSKALATEYQYELLNENDGFSSSIIFSIVQDQDGFLWFGTGYNGIMRYDGKNVVMFQHDPSDPYSLPNDNAGNLTLDSSGNLWGGSWGGSVFKLDAQSQRFIQYAHDKNDINTIGDVKVQHIFEDTDSVLWFGTFNAGINRFDTASNRFSRLPVLPSLKGSISDRRVWDIEQSEAGKLWVATDFGLNQLDIAKQEFLAYFPEPGAVLSDLNKIRTIEVNTSGDLYLGTQNGVVFFSHENTTFDTLANLAVPNMGPIYSMIATDFGEYWVSSDHGVFSFSDKDRTLKKVPLNFDDTCSQRLFQDKQGTIWLSCEGIGLYKITRSTIFQSFEEPIVKTAFALEIASDGNVLVGTSQLGLQKWNPETNQIIAMSDTDLGLHPSIRYITQTSNDDIWYANERSLFKLDPQGKQIEVSPPVEWWADFDNLKDIERDAADNIWIAAPHRIFILNPEDLSFDSIEIDKSEFRAIPSLELYGGPQGNMWVAINNKLYQWDKSSNGLVLFSNADEKDNYSELYNYIYSIFIDSRNQIWVSTKTGLYQIDRNSGLRTLISKDFIERENKGIRFISEDKSGVLWLVTPIGVSRLDPFSGDTQHFDKRDGLPGSRYFYNPTVRKLDGTIFLSSRDGISYFSPLSVKNRALDESTELTNFEVLGSENNFNVGEIQKHGITLEYNQSNVKFEFATLDLLNARQIQYSYFLDGFDDSWIENDNNSTATYTNLGGGDYVFRVRAKIKDSQWYQNELAVNLTIGIPFWERWWMFVVYVALAVFGILYYLQRQKRAVIKLEQQVVEKTADIAAESEKLAVANRIKTQFLANMSHEIRTPLTTVIGQAEAIICREVKPEDIHKEVEIIHDSSLYLLALLNDILDLTKIEENKFELERAPQDLHSLLLNINTMFSMHTRVKGLSFSMQEDLPRPFVIDVDGLRLKQILINLLSNALKFTLEGYVKLSVLADDERLRFHVEDTGIGISNDKVEQIFGSFTQGDSSIRRRFGGSGLGLHLSNQLAFMMGGEITVQSELNKGSLFTFSMPMPKLSSEPEQALDKMGDTNSSSPAPLFQGTVLLAEDHSDNRRLLARLLTKLGLTVFTAKDGFEAIELYKESAPEMVLMDIQMPNMDGLQAYKALRELGCDKPIIALTANAMTNEVAQYSALGFDGYIQKPIDRQLLIATVAKFFKANDTEVIRRATSVLGNVDMSDLVAEFKSSLFTELHEFEMLRADQDAEALQALTHRLSGAAYLFGFSELSMKATQLEAQLKSQQFSALEVEEHIDAIVAEINVLVADN